VDSKNLAQKARNRTIVITEKAQRLIFVAYF
jgi:hypothetical protein